VGTAVVVVERWLFQALVVVAAAESAAVVSLCAVEAESGSVSDGWVEWLMSWGLGGGHSTAVA